MWILWTISKIHSFESLNLLDHEQIHSFFSESTPESLNLLSYEQNSLLTFLVDLHLYLWLSWVISKIHSFESLNLLGHEQDSLIFLWVYIWIFESFESWARFTLFFLSKSTFESLNLVSRDQDFVLYHSLDQCFSQWIHCVMSEIHSPHLQWISI